MFVIQVLEEFGSLAYSCVLIDFAFEVLVFRAITYEFVQDHFYNRLVLIVLKKVFLSNICYMAIL